MLVLVAFICLSGKLTIRCSGHLIEPSLLVRWSHRELYGNGQWRMCRRKKQRDDVWRTKAGSREGQTEGLLREASEGFTMRPNILNPRAVFVNPHQHAPRTDPTSLPLSLSFRCLRNSAITTLYTHVNIPSSRRLRHPR
jgi:hypothetical protein